MRQADSIFGRRGALLTLLVALISASAVFYAYLKTSNGGDDDVLTFVAISQGVLNPERYRQLSNTVIDGIEVIGVSEEQLYRFEVRRDYVFNYFLPSILLRLPFSVLVDSFNTSNIFIRALQIGLALSFAVSILILVCVIIAIADARMIYAVSLMLFILTTSELAFIHWEYLIKFIRRNLPIELSVVANPGQAYSLFGTSPRSNFTLLLVAVFILRWRDRLSTSYIMLASLNFVHQTYALIVVCFLIMVDLLLRPKQLLNWTSAVAAASAIAISIHREVLIDAYFSGGALSIAILAILLGVLAFPTILSKCRCSDAYRSLLRGMGMLSLRPFKTALAWLLRQSKWTQDALLFGGLAMTAVGGSILLGELSLATDQRYLLDRLGRRLVGLAQPIVLLAIAIAVIKRIDERTTFAGEAACAPLWINRAVPMLITVVCAMSAVAAIEISRRQKDLLTTGLEERLPIYSAWLIEPPDRAAWSDIGAMEPLIYLAIIESMRSGEDVVAPLFVALRPTAGDASTSPAEREATRDQVRVPGDRALQPP